MTEFIAGILAFPTVMFTVALGIVAAYWLFVIVGAFDMDFIDGVLGLDAIEGVVDGVVDGSVDAILDASVEGAVEGMADGAVESVAEGAADAFEGAESHTAGGLIGLLNLLGLRGVPITITGSVVVLGAWMLSFFGMQVVAGRLAGGLLLLAASTALAILAFSISVVLSSILLRPLRRIFVSHPAAKRASLVGKLCRITTSRVDSRFGQAEIADGGSGFLAEVRCRDQNSLARNSQAIVFNYDPKEEIFHVAPVDETLKEADDRLGR